MQYLSLELPGKVAFDRLGGARNTTFCGIGARRRKSCTRCGFGCPPVPMPETPNAPSYRAVHCSAAKLTPTSRYVFCAPATAAPRPRGRLPRATRAATSSLILHIKTHRGMQYLSLELPGKVAFDRLGGARNTTFCGIGARRRKSCTRCGFGCPPLPMPETPHAPSYRAVHCSAAKLTPTSRYVLFPGPPQSWNSTWRIMKNKH